MRAIRVQYFLAYGIIGSTLPYISVYLRQLGLSEVQIGYVLAASSVAVVLSPVLVTLVADAHASPRRVLGGMAALAAITLFAMSFVRSFAAVLAVWTLHSLVYVPMTPLQDGIAFASQQRRREAGLPAEPYHRIRVWGTIGFIAAGAVVFGLLRWGMGLNAVLYCGAAFGVLSAIGSQFLPAGEASANKAVRTKLPTLEAARTMFRPPVLVFCIAIFLTYVATSSYYAFYAIYLTERLGMSESLVSPAFNVGVVAEVFFVLAAGLLVRWLGLKTVMVAGVVCIAVRLGLLAALPVAAVAIGSQVFHGIMAVVMHVVPPVFLNHHADDRFRHSMQGLYTMLVIGLGRIVGNLLAGPAAKWSLQGMFAVAAGVTLVAAILLAVAFRDTHPHDKRPG